MNEKRIQLIERSPYFFTEPYKSEYIIDNTIIISPSDVIEIYTPNRFSLSGKNDITKNNYSHFKRSNYDEVSQENDFIRFIQSTATTDFQELIVKASNLEKESYYYSFIGSFIICSLCTTNKAIYDDLSIASMSIELEERYGIVKPQFSFNINNEKKSWICSSSLDIKNDPLFISAIQKILEIEYSLSTNYIIDNILEAVGLIKLISY